MEKRVSLAIILVAIIGCTAVGCTKLHPQTQPKMPADPIKRVQLLESKKHEWIQNKSPKQVLIVIKWLVPNEDDGLPRVVWAGYVDPGSPPVRVPKVLEGMVIEGHFVSRKTDPIHNRGFIEKDIIKIDKKVDDDGNEIGWDISLQPSSPLTQRRQ